MSQNPNDCNVFHYTLYHSTLSKISILKSFASECVLLTKNHSCWVFQFQLNVILVFWMAFNSRYKRRCHSLKYTNRTNKWKTNNPTQSIKPATEFTWFRKSLTMQTISLNITQTARVSIVFSSQCKWKMVQCLLNNSEDYQQTDLTSSSIYNMKFFPKSLSIKSIFFKNKMNENITTIYHINN